MHAGEPEAGLLHIFGNGLTVKGVYEGTKGELEALVQFVIEKGIVPEIEEEVLPLERVGEGLERLVTGELGGKIVISLATCTIAIESREYFSRYQCPPKITLQSFPKLPLPPLWDTLQLSPSQKPSTAVDHSCPNLQYGVVSCTSTTNH
jgi:hypothetical protein